MRTTTCLFLLSCLLFVNCSKQGTDPQPPPSETTDPVKAIVICSTTPADRTSHLIVLNEDRTLRWQKTLPPSGLVASARYGNGRLYYNTSTGLEAYDINTGALLWKRKEMTSAPLVTDTALYTCSSGLVYEINPKTGEFLSNPTPVTDVVPRTPALTNGVLFVLTSTFYADYTVRALDLKTKTIKWSTPVGVNPPGPFAFSSGTLCLSKSNGNLLGLDAATGSVRWEKTDKGYGGYFLKGTTLYSTAGTIAAVDLQSGSKKWEWTPPPMPYAPTNFYFDGDNLSFEYLKTGNQLKALSLKCATGELVSDRVEAENCLYVNRVALKGGDKIYKIRVSYDPFAVKLITFDANSYKEIDSKLLQDEVTEDFQLITKSQN